MKIILTLPYPVSANRYWATRVVVPKGKKPMAITYVTEDAVAFKKQVQRIAKESGVVEPIAGRVAVHIQLYPKRPLDFEKRMRANPLYWADTVQRLDLDNARKVTNDALKEIAFADDKCIWRDSGEVMEPDGEARVVVTITPMAAQVSPQGGLFESVTA